MKKILGLDLGTNSIGWALVNEAENDGEKSSIIRLGVRVNPLTVDELTNFEKGKSITTNAERTLKRSMRRNLQRYKLRRENLIEILKEYRFISDETILSENGNKTTFETYSLRAKAATEEISLEQFARVLLMINKKRGYKSSRKAKNKDEDGALIDGMEVARKLYDENLTPGQYCLQLLEKGNKYLPDFYRSDLQTEFDKIWETQAKYHKELTDELKDKLREKNETQTWAICKVPFNIVGIGRTTKGEEKRKENFAWRVKSLFEKMELEALAVVLQKINSQINSSSGYLGAISDRSKELYFNKQTVGQYQMAVLNKNPNASLRNMVFYRQDYLDEFNAIWETQAKYHKELTDELKCKIRDVVIFYQRRLKSQKGLISFCEFENHKKEVIIDGKKKVINVGLKVIPRSSPLFQEFKIWQILNNIKIADKSTGEGEVTLLEQGEKEKLFAKLQITESLTTKEALEVLFEKRAKNYLLLNYEEKIEGNKTRAKIYEVLGENLTDENLNELWHLLYSWEGENKDLAEKITKKYGYPADIAKKLSNLTFPDDYGSLSSKAIKKIIPHLKQGNQYDKACELAGYAFSKNSLTKEQIENKVLKNKLDILSKNSLRNPVVEKILNQMIHIVNGVIDTYGKPNEIRIELARELKKNAKEREELTKSIADATRLHKEYRGILTKPPFNLSYVSRNDIIRYKLYKELKDNGYKTLYSNTYISQENLFSGDFDIEHIIPQSRLFDDSFSNKTLELRVVNTEKGNLTAYDFVKEKYGEDALENYLSRIEDLFKQGIISRAKYNKLKMQGKNIPDGFINRDLANTQYITKYAKTMLGDLVKFVISTTGSITERLREDWQLVDVMKELNWDKYKSLGLTEEFINEEGHKIRKIKDWTKRNDHRHHAMDALTVAFTKRQFIQYLNNLNARRTNEEQNISNTEKEEQDNFAITSEDIILKTKDVFGIERKELYKDKKGKLRFKPPMPLDEFRIESKKHLENILISIKTKNKVVTRNVNKIKKKNETNKKIQQTPRGQLHMETIYGSQRQCVVKEEVVNAKFDEAKILTVTKPVYKYALLKRLRENENSPKKAFTGKNGLEKDPIWLNELHALKVPEKVKTLSFETIYTIRKEISPDLNVDKIIDVKIKDILKKRLNEFKGDAKNAFTNLDKNPIWLNKEKGISIKCVTIIGVSNAEALHNKYDKSGKKQAVDFVNTGNNHHVAIYRDASGNLQENVVSFFETVKRANMGLPIIDKKYKQDEGWGFIFSLKQNEYFVFPNEKIGFNPKEMDLMNPENYGLISPNLFRVQKIASKDYWFRHHLETSVTNDIKDISYKRVSSLSFAESVVKVRINHIGQIVFVGEYD